MRTFVKKQAIWAILLIGVASITAYFALSAAFGLIQYSRLTNVSEARIKAWEIRPLRWGKYAIAAQYELDWKGKNLKKVTQFSSPLYLNHYAAENAVREMAKNNWKAWVSSSGSLASLEKSFPVNSCLRALISLGVLFYFIRIKNIINKY